MSGQFLILLSLSVGIFGAISSGYAVPVAVPTEERTVEFTQSSFAPGEPAVLLLRDEHLNSRNPCSAQWVDLDAPVPEDTLWSLLTGATQPDAYEGLNSSCQYDVESPSKTPILLNPIPQVSVNQTFFHVDNLNPNTGEFSINQEIMFDDSDLVFAFLHHTIDSIEPSEERARVFSSSDPTGEWIGLTEIDETDHDAPNPTTGLFKGQVTLSIDEGAGDQGDGAVLVNLGDEITVEYLTEGGQAVLASGSALVAEPTPTPTPIPSAGVTGLLVLAGLLAVVFTWHLNKRLNFSGR